MSVFRILPALALLALGGCSTFTVETDLSKQVSGNWSTTLDEGRNVTREPLARVALGFEPSFAHGFSVPISVEHRSYPGTREDRGEERVSVGLKWQPFKEGTH
ncbi:MAG: hypothetical protein WDO56_03950 [Gammaproteobacteria bacterium]